jgi:hypothetical protein
MLQPTYKLCSRSALRLLIHPMLIASEVCKRYPYCIRKLCLPRFQFRDRLLTNHVIDVLGNTGIAGLQRTTNQLSSQIRIYCDNDERFFSNPAGLLPSQAGPRYVWHDKKDWILADTLTSNTPSCRNPLTAFAAVTYTGVTEPPDGSDQPPDRSSITICPIVYQNGVTVLGNTHSARAMVRAGVIDLLQTVSSVTVVHEVRFHIQLTSQRSI